MPILHWLTRSADIEAASQVQYRVLEEVDSLHYGDKNSDNLLIQGDNLDALKALLPYYAGQVKCIYIDPPYNSGNAFDHYDDNLEHSLWLSIMYPRLQLLREFLAPEGTIWISIDDREGHYLKVLCDEIFGRQNFIADIAWRSSDSANHDATQFSVDHNATLVYSATPGWLSNKIARSEKNNAHYKNPDNDPKGPWFPGNLQSPNPRENLRFSLISPTGVVINCPKNGWRWSREKMEEMIASGEIIFTHNGTKVLRKTYLCNQKGLPPSSIWWDIEETGHNRQAKYELKKLFPDVATAELFKTPKPEKLIQRIFEISTQPGDLVMDTFLGSGTTAAVAHKMGRRYIGVEMGEHCVTHCQPRLVKVVDGEQGGISKSQNWTGGGGFRFYRLGAPLFNEEGLISREVTFKNLSAHIWFSETYSPIATGRTDTSAILGVHDDVAYVVLHPESSTTEVLTSVVLLQLKDELELQGYSDVKKIVVYGESCRMGDDRLREQGVVFKQIPYDVKAR